MKTTWKEALQNRKFRVVFGVTCVSLIILAVWLPIYFQETIGPRPGIVLNDWLLNQLTPHDWSVTIFVVIYAAVALTLFTNYRNPEFMLTGMVVYSLVTWIRVLTIYLFTLEPPAGIIYLRDPFLSVVVYDGAFMKDLFFSGHISTMTVLILMEPVKLIKWIQVAATTFVASLILIQHVHYSIDVFMAPVFTYAVYRLVLLVKKPLTN